MEASRVRRPLRRLAQLGSPSERSFEQLYRRHARDVYQYALAVLSNPTDAEDVTQTTFLNAYRAFQKGERPQKPHNWLIAIAHNVCRMRWRQAGSRPTEVALDSAPEPVALELERSDLGEVLTALAQLSFNQRAALVMRELEGRSYQEISEVLGVSVSAVEALLFRARRKLQLKRDALGVITTVPLPGSLAGLFGGGGGVAAAGGAALVLKTAAVVVIGTAVAGAGYKTVNAANASEATARPQSASTVLPSRQPAAAKQTNAPRRGKRISVTSRNRRGARAAAGGQAARPTSSTASTASAAAPGQTSAPAPSAASSSAATPPAATVVVKPPPLPSVPPAPPLPVKLPPVPPLPPLPPPPPVTVTVPTLPPPPPLP